MAKITQERMQEVRNAFRVLGSLTDEELRIFSKFVCIANVDTCKVSDSKERTFEDVTEIIYKLGVRPNIKGYNYLRSAIIFCLKANKKVSITKELYPSIAKEYDSTSQRVERAIRHAIHSIFEKGNMDVIQEVFGTKEVLTNSEAIASITEYLNRKH